MENYKHKTVLPDEAVNGLNIRPDGIYIDGTFGRGGHSRLILSQLGPEGRLIAIDRDPQAIEAASAIDDPRFSIVHGPFSALADYARERDLQGRSTVSFSILAFLHRSLTTQSAVSPLCATGRWTCGWTRLAGNPPPSGYFRQKRATSPGC